jgi:hypothetical protein
VAVEGLQVNLEVLAAEEMVSLLVTDLHPQELAQTVKVAAEAEENFPLLLQVVKVEMVQLFYLFQLLTLLEPLRAHLQFLHLDLTRSWYLLLQGRIQRNEKIC